MTWQSEEDKSKKKGQEENNLKQLKKDEEGQKEEESFSRKEPDKKRERIKMKNLAKIRGYINSDSEEEGDGLVKVKEEKRWKKLTVS